jgi:integral membrane protein (TIGR01906 family)
LTAIDVAYGSVLPSRRLPRWMTVVVALSGAFAGVVALVLLYAGAGTYADIARAAALERIPFHVPGTAPVEQRQEVRYDIGTRVALHSGTLRFVLSQDPGTPRDPTTRDPLFDRDEQGHLADVRGVFTFVEIGALVAAVAAIAVVFPVVRAGRTIVLRLVRDSAVLATIVVALIGAVFAVAFEPAFLAFHYVFFPQGNFLFDPATSNLLALYPEQYWYAVTLRIGATFTLLMVGVVVVVSLALRARTAP